MRLKSSGRKIHLQNWMADSGINHGSEYPVWEVEIGTVHAKIGIVIICYDIQVPEAAREVALGGAEVLFMPYCTDDFSRTHVRMNCVIARIPPCNS